MKHPERSPISASRLPIRRLLVWAAVLAVPLAGGPFQDARASCREVVEALREALAAADLDAARHRYEAVYGEFSCTDGTRAQAKRAVSNLHAQVAKERMAGGASLASQRALLERGRGYAGTWLTLALLGEIAHDERDYDRAAELYQDALVAINDEVETPEPPPESQIERIARLAAQSRMLARRFVETPTNRSNEPDGLAAAGWRGVGVEAEPLPITFETGKAEFDARGRRWAEDLAKRLSEQGPGQITLTAHTDERGTDAYNLALSERRGEAVLRFLKAQGVTQPIKVVAKGERQPLDLADPEHYGQEEVWRMNRRVEWVR